MQHTHRYQNSPSPHSGSVSLGPMIAGSVAAGAMFTLWNYARHQKNPYLQYGTLALGGAAVSVGQHLLRGAVKAASR